MDINKCPKCQKQFDQDKRVSKKLPCECISCLKCLKNVYQFAQEIKCIEHKQVYNTNPEEFETFVVQEPIPEDLPQPYVNFIDQVKINKYYRWLQGQYTQKQNYYAMLRESIQDRVKFMKHIQEVSMHLIYKTLIDQFSMSNAKIENLIKRLSEFQVPNEVYQKYQDLILGQQDSHLSQKHKGQIKQQFQQILSEIDQLKKNQWMEIQSLGVNIQRCLLNMFVYLRDNSSDQLLTDNQADLLIQKYFKQIKVQNSLSQVQKSVVQQKISFKSQRIDQQRIEKIQNIEQQQKSQVIDDQQGQDIAQDQQLQVQEEISLQGQNIVQVQQFQVQEEISLQEQQIIDARLMVNQIEQNLMNIQNDIKFNNQVNQLCKEQESLIKYAIEDFKNVTFDKLVQFLNQIKEENMSIQVIKFSTLNKSGLIVQVEVLQQLSTVTDQSICLKLSQIIQLSKNQPQIQQAAANALTILNYMNYTFTNEDFSNSDLTNSDLSDTTFNSCKFANSNLTQVNLRNSKFISCDLSNANLTSIITEHPHIFTDHTSSVTAVAISCDSRFIVSGSYDYTVRIWNIETGTCSQIMSGHTSSVTAVAISSDSQFIVSGSRDNTVRIWNIETGNSQIVRGHTSSVWSVAISRNSEFIVSGSGDNTVRIWNIKTGISQIMSGHTSYATAVAISCDSEFIVSGSSDNTLIIWNIKIGTCSQIKSAHESSVTAVAISSDSEFIVSGSLDKTIRL